MTPLPASYTSLSEAAEKVWALWFDDAGSIGVLPRAANADIRAPTVSNADAEFSRRPSRTGIRNETEEGTTSTHPPQRRTPLGPAAFDELHLHRSSSSLASPERVFRLKALARCKLVWGWLLNRIFSIPLPIYHLQEDGSLSRTSRMPEPSVAHLTDSVMTFVRGGSTLSGTLIVPTQALDAFITSLVVSGQGPRRDIQVDQDSRKSDPPVSVDGEKRRGGAPPKHDAEAFLIEAFRLLYEGFVPESPAQLRRRALERYWEKKAPSGSNAEPPSDEWAKPKIRKLWGELGLDRSS